MQIDGAPQIDILEPTLRNRNKSVTFTAIGANLNQAQISFSLPELQISKIHYPSDSKVTFDLFTADAPLGPVDLVFTNLFGKAVETISILESLRIISTFPNGNPPIFNRAGE